MLCFIRRTIHLLQSLDSSQDTQRRSAGPKIPQVLRPVPTRAVGTNERPRGSSLWRLLAQIQAYILHSALFPSFLRAA
jgi:hypothetical protein